MFSQLRIAPAAVLWRSLALTCCLAPGSLAQAALGQGEVGGVRETPVGVRGEGRTGFTLISPERTGVFFTNRLADRTVASNRVYENGSGVALGDVDGDGWCDLYFCRLEGPNALYRNRGNWQFEESTGRAGVACPNQFSTGAAFADIDGDGDLDLLVNAIGGGTRAFLNNGQGQFTELTGTRLVRRFGSTSLALADIEGDGDLDLYVTNYRTDTYKDRPRGLKVEAAMVNGQISVTPADRFVALLSRGNAVEVMELGERDFLYVNDGAGRFAPVTWTSGSFLDEDGQPLTGPPLDWGLTVAFRDLDGNGTPDLYVCNDFFYSPDRVWLNRARRGFQAIPRTALRNMSMSSMAVDFADINRDGYDDIFVADMLSRNPSDRHRQRPNMMKGVVHTPLSDPNSRPEVARNTLFLNRGDGTFAEIAQLSGLASTEWSWSVVFLDVDLDGYEDLLVANGNTRDVQDADALQQIALVRDNESPETRLKRFPPLATENLALRNRGDLTFEDASARWGFNLKGVSQGMALGDLDNDGDLDVVLNNLNSAAALYRNEAGPPRVAVRLQGNPPNRRGIGAKIRVSGGPVPQSQEMMCGGRYLSCDDTMRVFAAGTVSNRLRIEVTWPSGKTTVLAAAPNRIYEIAETGTSETQADSARGAAPEAPAWFEDVSAQLRHTHYDQPFDDFHRQPLLTHRLSQLGPGVGWIDLDGDGWDDLVIGTGRGGRPGVFRNAGGNEGKMSFAAQETALELRDQTSVLGWGVSSNRSLALVGSTNYEEPGGSPSAVGALTLGEPPRVLMSNALPAAVGPLALGDVDQDGDLDLFVGGRTAGGRYPEPVPSRVFRQTEGGWELDETSQAVLGKLGLVSSAAFSDLDGDGNVELLLACEWGPIRTFRVRAGRWEETTGQNGLAEYFGWWNGVTTGDFDGDGRLDIAAANWGRNTKYQAVISHPLRVCYGDFTGSGRLDVVEAFFDRESGRLMPWRDFETMSRSLPFIRERVSSFREYGQAGVEQILGPQWSQAHQGRASTLDSLIFLNRGGHFEARVLPIEAQFAPAFGLTVSDFDGDGREDLFLSQNFFGVEPETSRYDGGRGLLLRGDGEGGFNPVPGQVSGIRVEGEQRGCAVSDFDRDARPDLVVSQNSGPTRLFRNREARPGLRVRLAGPRQNPSGVGAMIRLRTGSRLGPARAVQAGAGYWSQDSFTLVMGTPQEPAAVWVRWPGGKESMTPVPAGVRDILVRWEGEE